jgi:hypothetical protein
LKLWIDNDLETVTWSGGSCSTYPGKVEDWMPPQGDVSVCEVWGCGGETAEAAQVVCLLLSYLPARHIRF